MTDAHHTLQGKLKDLDDFLGTSTAADFEKNGYKSDFQMFLFRGWQGSIA